MWAHYVHQFPHYLNTHHKSYWKLTTSEKKKNKKSHYTMCLSSPKSQEFFFFSRAIYNFDRFCVWTFGCCCSCPRYRELYNKLLVPKQLHKQPRFIPQIYTFNYKSIHKHIWQCMRFILLKSVGIGDEQHDTQIDGTP